METRNKLIDRLERRFEAIADWSIRHRWQIALMTLLLLCTGGWFASKVRVDNSLSTFFFKDDPAYIAYTQYLDDFVSDEVVYIMYHAPQTEHGPFDLEVMRVVAELTETLESEVPFLREATSLANVEFVRPSGEDSIEVDELLIEFPQTQQELLKSKRLIFSKPFYIDYLINSSGDYAAIILQMELNSTTPVEETILDPDGAISNSNTYPAVSDEKVREILARPSFANAGIQYYISGDVPMNTAYINAMIEDMGKITALAMVLLALLSLLIFRATWIGVFGPITVVVTSVVLTLGLLGALDWPVGNFFSVLPTLICAVGVAQSVHVLLEYQRILSQYGDRNRAIKGALHRVGVPCLMAALTTAVGIGVMSVSNLKMLAEFGVYSAFGIMATFLLSTTLLVIFLVGRPDQNHVIGKRQMAIWPFFLPVAEKCVELNIRYPRLIIGLFAVVFVLSIGGITQLRNDFNFLAQIKPHVEWRQHTEKVEQEMGGTLRMSYLIDTGVAEGVKNPELLRHIEKIQRFAEQLPLVRKSLSVADVIKDLNLTFHANDKQYYRVPDEVDLLAQYFLVYELSGGRELEEFVSLDFSRTVIELQVEMTYASNVNDLLQSIDEWVEQNPLPGAVGQKTGIGLLWVKLAQYIGDTQAKSYALVFTMIAVLMCVSFGSVRVGMLSMVSNLAPVVLALGVLGWSGIPLDHMKLLFATIAIGIAVDDTIHLVTRFRQRFHETGNYETALRLCLTDVGPALMVTSIILIFAFAAYLVSNTVILSHMGVMLGGTILVALITDLFLMPVLLMRLKPFGPEFTPE